MIEFRTSSFCSLGNCVEVAVMSDEQVAVRDSKDPNAGPLIFTAEEWSAFVAGVCAGEFDPACLQE